MCPSITRRLACSRLLTPVLRVLVRIGEISAKDCFSCLTVIMGVSLVDGDVHGGAVLGVEGEYSGAGGGAGLLRKPGGLLFQRGAEHNPTVFSEIRYLHGVEMPGEQDLRRSWLAP